MAVLADWRVLARLPVWLAGGRARLKQELAARWRFAAAQLPYSDTLLRLVKRERAHGRRIVLCTAADRQVAEAVAEHLGVFDEVIASEGTNNLRGVAAPTRRLRVMREQRDARGTARTRPAQAPRRTPGPLRHRLRKNTEHEECKTFHDGKQWWMNRRRRPAGPDRVHGPTHRVRGHRHDQVPHKCAVHGVPCRRCTTRSCRRWAKSETARRKRAPERLLRDHRCATRIASWSGRMIRPRVTSHSSRSNSNWPLALWRIPVGTDPLRG